MRMPFTNALCLAVAGAASAYRAAGPLPDLLLVAERAITVQTPDSLLPISPPALARAWGVLVD